MTKITEQQLVEMSRNLRAKLIEGSFDNNTNSTSADPDSAEQSPWGRNSLGQNVERFTRRALDTPVELLPTWLGGTSTKFKDPNGTTGYTFQPNWNELGYAGQQSQHVTKRPDSGYWMSDDGQYVKDEALAKKLEIQALKDMAKTGVKPSPMGWNPKNPLHVEAQKSAPPAPPAPPGPTPPGPTPPGPTPPGPTPPGPTPPGPTPPGPTPRQNPKDIVWK